MNIKEALEKGILIKESKSLLKVDKYDPCIIFSYTAIFHAARALLFKEGYREKGHLGVIIFLEDFYSNKIGRKLIYEFDRLRKERHDLLYGLEKEKISEESAKHTLIISEKFIKKIEELLWN